MEIIYTIVYKTLIFFIKQINNWFFHQTNKSLIFLWNKPIIDFFIKQINNWIFHQTKQLSKFNPLLQILKLYLVEFGFSGQILHFWTGPLNRGSTVYPINSFISWGPQWKIGVKKYTDEPGFSGSLQKSRICPLNPNSTK